jgi:hypothetical protein
MLAKTISKQNTSTKSVLKAKADMFDELVDFIEDRALGHLMSKTEKEKNITLGEARKSVRM